MNIFKIVNLPVKQVTFKEWKVKENSKLAFGSIILIYEYTAGVGGTVFIFLLFFCFKYFSNPFFLFRKSLLKALLKLRKLNRI